MVLKSVSLNLLEPSGPVLACNGIAFLYSSVQFLWLMMALRRKVETCSQFQKMASISKNICDWRAIVSVGRNQKEWFSYQGTPTLTGTRRAELRKRHQTVDWNQQAQLKEGVVVDTSWWWQMVWFENLRSLMSRDRHFSSLVNNNISSEICVLLRCYAA